MSENKGAPEFYIERLDQMAEGMGLAVQASNVPGESRVYINRRVGNALVADLATGDEAAAWLSGYQRAIRDRECE